MGCVELELVLVCIQYVYTGCGVRQRLNSWINYGTWIVELDTEWKSRIYNT